eukprot:3298253-Pyramimonas_sp.AAC.1
MHVRVSWDALRGAPWRDLWGLFGCLQGSVSGVSWGLLGASFGPPGDLQGASFGNVLGTCWRFRGVS